mmetsp:Transcript_41526/g.125842  ORF Transcript_41526/g.125842 Transcript_41526/m.125842 type:complete len:264 (+) Transcript_41526:305-1096(+)
MRNLLPPVLTVVDHDPRPVAESQTLVPRNLSGRHQQLPQYLNVLGVRFAQRRQSRSILGYDQYVRGRRRVNILEGEKVLFVPDDRSGNVPRDDFVKDRFGGGVANSRHPDGIPSSVGVPLFEGSVHLVVHPGKIRVPLLHCVEPRANLGRQSLILGHVELGEHVLHEHHRRKQRRIGEGYLPSAQVQTVRLPPLLDRAVDDAELLPQFGHGILPHPMYPERISRRLVQASLHGSDVHVVQSSDEVRSRIVGKERRSDVSIVRR